MGKNLVSRVRDFVTPSREEFFTPIETYFNSFFDDFFKVGPTNILSCGYPKLDILTHNGKYSIEAALPGLHPEDISIEMIPEKRMLKISGKKTSAYDESTQWHIKELKRSAFERTVGLPDFIEGDPEATMKDGVLRLVWTIPEAKPPEKKMISIKSDA